MFEWWSSVSAMVIFVKIVELWFYVMSWFLRMYQPSESMAHTPSYIHHVIALIAPE